MGEVDDETVERVIRWCAEAGRHAAAAEIRAALGVLGWGELLAARALLAEPPPARPLGPFALADLARGAPPDVAAEREREGRYGPEISEATSRATPPRAAAAPARAARRGGASARATVFVRRAADRTPAPPAAPAALPHLADLFFPEGRATLERWLRRLGGRRAAVLAELAATHAAPEGVGDRELDALLDHHGLATAFAHRERDELLHALRAEGGSLERAASRVGLDRPALEAALARLGAGADAERIREERRTDLRRRSTLADRVAALLGDEARLRDLGLLAEIEADLTARLPEHVRALRAAGESPAEGLARTLSVGPAQAAFLAARFGLAIPAHPRAAAAPARPAARPPAAGARPRGARPGGPRPAPPPGRPAPPAGGPARGVPRRRTAGAGGRPPGARRGPGESRPGGRRPGPRRRG